MRKCFFLWVVSGLLLSGVSGKAQTIAYHSFYRYFWNPIPESVEPVLTEMPAIPEPAQPALTGTSAVSEEAFSFSAAQTGTGNLLRWDVPQPELVTNVIIEGSADGFHFTDLESLADAEAGALDVFYDAAPSGRRYYRLVANYPDGQQRATPIAHIENPVPFEVQLPSGTSPLTEVWSRDRIEIYDLQGTLLTMGDPVDGHYAFDLQGLPIGVPILIRSGSHKQVVVR